MIKTHELNAALSQKVSFALNMNNSTSVHLNRMPSNSLLTHEWLFCELLSSIYDRFFKCISLWSLYLFILIVCHYDSIVLDGFIQYIESREVIPQPGQTMTLEWVVVALTVVLNINTLQQVCQASEYSELLESTTF